MSQDTAQNTKLDYYQIKAACWLDDHYADKDANPHHLAIWAKDHAEGSHWAAVAQDGSVVGQAEPVTSSDVVIYYTTAETAERYHLDLRTEAEQAISEMEKAVGMRIIWARNSDLSGHLWPAEKEQYEQILARRSQTTH